MSEKGRSKAAKASYHHGDLRSALLEAAVEVIGEVGFSKLSLRECARRAGVSHAAPYRHFADKDALLLSLALQGFSRLYETAKTAMEGIEDPIQRLDAYGVAYIKFALENPVYYRAMFSLDIKKTDQTENNIADQAFALLVQCAAEAYPEQKDPMLPALAAWSLPHGFSMLILDGRVCPEVASSPEKAGHMAQQMFDLWRNAIHPS